MGSCCACGHDAFDRRYSVDELLGKGSQGRVYACVDRESGQACAVKVIDRSHRNAWMTYSREVDACVEAQGCPNVIRILDHFTGSATYTIVMPKYKAHMRKALKATFKMQDWGVGLEDAVLRRIILQAMSALKHLHALEIVHRDVKAQNFLTDQMDLRHEEVSIVLGDFGLARRLQVGEHLSESVGTRKYWAPDVYQRRYWHNVDVFAIGVLIFLAGSGAYPFANHQEARDRDIFFEGACPSILSSGARDVMRLCLAKDPYARPGACEVLDQPWLASGAAEPANTEGRSEDLTVADDGRGAGDEASCLLPQDTNGLGAGEARKDEKDDDGEGETSVADGDCGSQCSSTSPLARRMCSSAVGEGARLLEKFGDEGQWHYAL